MNSIILAVIAIMVVLGATLLVKKISSKKTEETLPTSTGEQDTQEQEAIKASKEQEEAAPAQEPVEQEEPQLVEPTPIFQEASPAPVAEKKLQEPEEVAEEIPVEPEKVQSMEMEETEASPLDIELESEEAAQPAETIVSPVSLEMESSPLPEKTETGEPEPGQEPALHPEADEQEAAILDQGAPKATDATDEPAKKAQPAFDIIEPEEPDAVKQEQIAEEPVSPAVAEEEQQEPKRVDEQLTTEPASATPIDTEEIAAQVAVATIKLTLEQYAERLNQQEEQQREALQQAIATQQDQKRDTLQRELVLMNEKLAVLDESYQEELSCYDNVLQALEELENSLGQEAVAQAKNDLIAGRPEAAESLLADLMNASGTAKGVGAFYSGMLAEHRFDLLTALQRYQTAVEADSENSDYLYAAGLTARRLFKYNDAVKWLEQYVTICAGTYKDDPVLLAQAKRELAYTYVTSGQHKKAGPMYKDAMTGFSKHLGPESPEMAISWFQIGELQETLGEYDKAAALYKKALAILEKKQGKDHPMLTGVLDKLAALCMELEMEKEAVPLYERLVAIRNKTLRPNHPQLAMSLNNLAESYRLQRQYAEAEGCYQKSLSIAEQTQGKDHPSVGAILQELAKLCSNQRKNDEAEKYQTRATAIFEKAVAAEEKRSKNTSLSLDL